MKRLIVFCIALACAGFIAPSLLAAPTAALPVAANAPAPDGVVLPAPAAPPAHPQMSSTHYALDWTAVGEISGGASASAGYKLNATIGQMAANTSSISTSYRLCTGFECVLNSLSLYLPLIRR